MVFPKPLGDFYIALLSSLVAAAQKKDNRPIVNRIINTVTGAMIYLQLHNTFANVADRTKVPSPYPSQTGTDAYCRDLIAQLMSPFTKWFVPVFVGVVRYSEWLCLHYQ
jgi:ABC-type microcin C transport system permease subunit YejE